MLWCLFGKLSKHLLSVLGRFRVDRLRVPLSPQRDRGSCSIKLGHQQSQGGPRNPYSSEWMTAIGLGAKRLLKLLQSPAVPQCQRMHSSSARERTFSVPYLCVNSLLWGPNTLVFCRFTELHCVSLPASFSDTLLHWWESHSPIPHFFAKNNTWGNHCSFTICLPAVGIFTDTVK